VTALYLRTRPVEREPKSALLLDWFGRGGTSTVSGRLSDLVPNGENADPSAIDLLRLAIGVYGADKVVSRSSQPDRWTRSLELRIPVSDSDKWSGASASFIAALQFLTNDRWALRFRSDGARPTGPGTPLFGADAVCLFSGGLDSLTGAINLLEEGRRVMLVGHYDSNLLRPRQAYLFECLRDHYGADAVSHRPFYLRLASRRDSQARSLPSKREPTTRSRSFLFISAAVTVASALGLDHIYMPENGYIGLNIPLEVSRLGACSTRTTHPHFMALLTEALTSAGVGSQIENPFRLLTKGEIISTCRNRDLLEKLIPDSVSCAHPEVGRWRGAGYGNCGYCYPCLMRRASLHHLGWDDATAYRVDVGDPAFLTNRSVRTGHLRALIANETTPQRSTDVLRSGPLPRGEVTAFADLYARGRKEVAAWLKAAVPASR
jgi:7-cyano-7-deazaguanine synthase in queuosine biosynthesis